jgi:hypothetical protein
MARHLAKGPATGVEATLETFFPVPRVEVIAGRRFEILPVRMKHFPRFTAATEPFIAQVPAGNYLGALLREPDAVRAAIAIATGAETEWLDDLYPDEMVRLMAAVFEVNLDFFALRLLPARQQAAAAMAALLIARAGPDGPPPSPGSSAPDTGSMPSAS